MSNLQRLLILIIALPLACFAAPHTYTVKVEATSHSRTNVKEDLEIAFYNLINNLTKKIDISPIGYDKLFTLVDQYQYESLDGKTFMIADFDRKATQKYLEEIKIDTAQKEDLLILYAAHKVGSQTKLLDPDTDQVVLGTISQQAKKEGLNVISPTMDLTDLDSLKFDDVWQQNYPALDKTAQRYQAKGILVLKLSQRDGEDWSSDWHLYKNGRSVEAAVDNGPIEALTHEALQRLKQKMAQAEELPTTKEIFVQFNNPKSNESYQAFFKTLKNLPGVLEVQLDGVTPDSVLYKLSVDSDKVALINHLKGHQEVIFEPTDEDNIIQLHIEK